MKTASGSAPPRVLQNSQCLLLLPLATRAPDILTVAAKNIPWAWRTGPQILAQRLLLLPPENMVPGWVDCLEALVSKWVATDSCQLPLLLKQVAHCGNVRPREKNPARLSSLCQLPLSSKPAAGSLPETLGLPLS